MTIEVTLQRGDSAGEALALVKSIIARYPGGDDVRVKIGATRLTLGSSMRADANEMGCLLQLRECGEVAVA